MLAANTRRNPTACQFLQKYLLHNILFAQRTDKRSFAIAGLLRLSTIQDTCTRKTVDQPAALWCCPVPGYLHPIVYPCYEQTSTSSNLSAPVDSPAVRSSRLVLMLSVYPLSLSPNVKPRPVFYQSWSQGDLPHPALPPDSREAIRRQDTTKVVSARKPYPPLYPVSDSSVRTMNTRYPSPWI